MKKAIKSGTAENKSILFRLTEFIDANPIVSPGIVFAVMVVLQTVTLGFNYGSFSEWFSAFGTNWLNILRNNSSVGIISLAMTLVIISGGIDLAVGSTCVAVGCFAMMLMSDGGQGFFCQLGITGVPLYILTIISALLLGVLLGLINGGLIAFKRIPPFIVTLGMMKILRSVTQHFVQSKTYKVPSGFLKIANVKIGGQMLMPVVYWLIVAVVLFIVLNKTSFGKHIFAVGSNEKATLLSGVNVKRVKLGVYALMGAIVSIAAVLQVSRIGAMDPANAGSGYELDSIAAVIVGGTGMSGGRGSIIGTVLGMLIIAVMNNFLNLLGVPPFLREAFKGAIIILAVLLQRSRSEK